MKHLLRQVGRLCGLGLLLGFLLAVVEGAEAEAASSAGAGLSNKPTHWAFVKPVNQDPPEVRLTEWVHNDIDRFILARLEENGLTPAEQADRRVLIRRVHFDLIGLPPTPDEVDAFVESSSPTAYEDLVDSLLDHPGYGQRWGRYWLDLARYSDSLGFEGDPEIYHTWRYRDYVIDALNNDKPYDEFIKEQLAGDELAPVVQAQRPPLPGPEQRVALTFLRLAPFKRTPLSEENRDVLLSEMTSTVSSVFLGLTLECAKCHDHKYDPIPQKDFYRMQAFFANVFIPASPDELAGKGGPRDLMGGTLPCEFYRPGEKERMDAARGQYTGELTAAEAELAELELPEEKSDGDTATEDKQEISPEDQQRIGELKPHILRLNRQIERLAPVAFSVQNAIGPPLGPAVPTTYVLVRGNYDNPGEPVKPGFLSAITGHSNPADLPIDRFRMLPGRGWRLALANWIASPDNPLTARVMVNRIWQYHFGQGIVDTPSNFGANGHAPTHGQLLDWLANRFVAEQWSMKAMHRLILNSNTFRQTCTSHDPAAEKIDPENQLLSRFNRQRLEGEIIRDAILATSGRLNLDQGGPPVFPSIPAEVEKANNRVRWDTSPEPDGRKRSIYVHQRRMLNYPFLKIFDAPVLNTSCSRRKSSVTVLQSLAMYDSKFVNDEAKLFAERVTRESDSTTAGQIRQAFRLALSRDPSEAELERAQGFLNSNDAGENPLVGFCRVLYNTSEFLYVD